MAKKGVTDDRGRSPRPLMKKSGTGRKDSGMSGTAAKKPRKVKNY